MKIATATAAIKAFISAILPPRSHTEEILSRESQAKIEPGLDKLAETSRRMAAEATDDVRKVAEDVCDRLR